MVLVEFAALQPVVGKIMMTGIIFLINFIMKKYLLFYQKTTVHS